jgi:hypothetical protein
MFVLSLVVTTGWSCGRGYGVSNVEPTDANEAPETPDITAVWQTYRDETYGVEFKYPEGWIYWESREGAESLRSISFDVEGAEYTSSIDFMISAVSPTSLEDEERELASQGFDVVERSVVTINGVEWRKTIIQDQETPLQFIDYITEQEGRSYAFSSDYAGHRAVGAINQRNMGTLNGMLNSFRFSE